MVGPAALMTVNGEPVETGASTTISLLDALRGLGLCGTTGGCDEGECGSCSVLVDGVLVCSCLTLAATCDGTEITTIEGVVAADLAQALIDEGAVQCGFCTPGFVMAAVAALDSGQELDRPTVIEALSGNLCRCTGYQGLIEAVVSVGRSRAAS